MEGPVTALAMVLGSGLPFGRRSKQVIPAESLSTESLPAITNKPTGSIGTHGKKTPGKTFGSLSTVRNSLDRPGAFASRLYNAEGHVTYRFVESRERRRQHILNNNKFALWRERLLRVSRIGSILCVIDCTLLPIVTLLLPLLGVANPHLEWLHDLGHSMGIYFVLPVGSMAASLNYASHRKNWLAAMALIGLFLVYAANGHGGPILSLLPHHIVHAVHCHGPMHKVCNIAGCALLLSSNYFGHRINVANGKALCLDDDCFC